MTADATIGRLRQLGAATVHEAQGGIGAMDSAIKPLAPQMTLAGRAVTVSTAPTDNLAIQYAATIAGAGDVLVIDAKGYLEAGHWGAVLTTFAQCRGLGGLVIDGSVRDSREIIGLAFPTFSRGICIKGTSKCTRGEINTTVSCGGVRVRPGDVVVGDADGVVVVPGDEADRIVELAEARESKEARFRQAFSAGATLIELLGLSDKLDQLGYR